MERNLTCIGCPLGCQITVKINGSEIEDIAGFTCKRGREYAEKEVTHPTRIVTSTIKVNAGTRPVTAVKTRSDIPKEKIFEVMEAIKNAAVDAPVHIGDVVLADAAGSGVDIVATAAC